MAKLEQAAVETVRCEKVTVALGDGARTWDELRALTKINEEWLGLTLGELLDQRRIWTRAQGDVRYYGLERRAGLVPRNAHAGDLAATGQLAYAVWSRARSCCDRL